MSSYTRCPHVDVQKLEQYGGRLTSTSGQCTEAELSGWVFRSTRGPIATEAQKSSMESSRGHQSEEPAFPALPEQLFINNSLVVQHRLSGVSFTFRPEAALSQWLQDNNEPVQVVFSSKWQKDRRGVLESIDKLSYDWTFTTSYTGGVEGSTCQKSSKQMDMNLLTDRNTPILYFDSFPLYVSELDDMGTSEMLVKIRVMPTCWFVLLRFFLRIDGQMVRLKDTRYYCEMNPNSDSQGGIVLRESRCHESHDVNTVKSCIGPDEAAQVLQALAPVGITRYSMDEFK
jgi:type 2A phosphatase activator TIP41